MTRVSDIFDELAYILFHSMYEYMLIIYHSSYCAAEGANGDGMAVISSLRSFDREQQKEYLIPIVIKDAGNPAMSGTSTLTVIIGDVNDNKMQPGSKEILVYNYVPKNVDYSVPVSNFKVFLGY